MEEAVRNKLYFLGKKDVSLQNVSFCLNSFLTAFSIRALEGHKYNPGEFWESRDDLGGRWRGANSRWWGRGRLAFPPSVISEQLLRPCPACSQRPSSATRLPRQPRREGGVPPLASRTFYMQGERTGGVGATGAHVTPRSTARAGGFGRAGSGAHSEGEGGDHH